VGASFFSTVCFFDPSCVKCRVFFPDSWLCTSWPTPIFLSLGLRIAPRFQIFFSFLVFLSVFASPGLFSTCAIPIFISPVPLPPPIKNVFYLRRVGVCLPPSIQSFPPCRFWCRTTTPSRVIPPNLPPLVDFPKTGLPPFSFSGLFSQPRFFGFGSLTRRGPPPPRSSYFSPSIQRRQLLQLVTFFGTSHPPSFSGCFRISDLSHSPPP